MIRKSKQKYKNTAYITFLSIAAIILSILIVLCIRQIIQYHSAWKEYTALNRSFFVDDTANPGINATNENIKNIEKNAVNLKNQNNGYIGWLYIPGMGISYPVCQASDNEYYLNHTFDGNINHSGCLFMDYNRSINDLNTFIYGHNMLNDTMFGKLEDIIESPADIFVFVTPERTYKYQIFSAHETAKDSSTYAYLNDGNELKDYMEHELEVSEKDYGISDISDSSILTLSTCSGFGTTKKRFVVQGRLINP